jgi:hypothetical protein
MRYSKKGEMDLSNENNGLQSFLCKISGLRDGVRHEPETYAMMFAGLVGLSFVARRKAAKA